MAPKHREKVDELAKRTAMSMRVTAERLYNCGGVAPDEYEHKGELLSRILLCSALRLEVCQLERFFADDVTARADYENLLHNLGLVR